jgi:hypothetical protein
MMILQRGSCRQSQDSLPRKSRPAPVSQHRSHHSHYRNTATAAENRRGNSGEPKRIWADPACLPPDTVGYTAAVITAVEQGLTFTLNGW